MRFKLYADRLHAILEPTPILKKLRSFGRLSRRERGLALQAIGLTAAARLAVWMVPFRLLQRAGQKRGEPRQARENAPTAREIAWAVRLAARSVPRATCLVQALAAQALLGWHGHAARIHIGVALEPKARDSQAPRERFRAHAWVECEGEVLVGGSEELGSYSPLLVLKASTPSDRGNLQQ